MSTYSILLTSINFTSLTDLTLLVTDSRLIRRNQPNWCFLLRMARRVRRLHIYQCDGSLRKGKGLLSGNYFSQTSLIFPHLFQCFNSRPKTFSKIYFWKNCYWMSSCLLIHQPACPNEVEDRKYDVWRATEQKSRLWCANNSLMFWLFLKSNS